MTDTVAIAYLAIIIALLVFSFGLPGWILQIASPEKLRKLAIGYKWKMFCILPFAIIVLFVSSLIFLWYLFKYPDWTVPAWMGNGAIIIGLDLAIAAALWCQFMNKSILERIVDILQNDFISEYEVTGRIDTKKAKDLNLAV